MVGRAVYLERCSEVTTSVIEIDWYGRRLTRNLHVPYRRSLEPTELVGGALGLYLGEAARSVSVAEGVIDR